MLAQCVHGGYAIEDYLDPQHPIQQNILHVFADVAGVEPETVQVGIDGCSAPTFGIPLRSAALAFARLCDPTALPAGRARALERIYHAMTTHPDMVSGPGRFDTRLMETAGGKVVAKGGAEGYQSIGVAPGACGAGSPAMGITYKVMDGDPTGRARAIIGITVLRALGALDAREIVALADFDGPRPIHNWRRLEVGVIRPVFALERVLA
jgi:L-asparaginase II